MVFSLYAAFAASLVVTTVVVAILIPFVVGFFDRHDLF